MDEAQREARAVNHCEARVAWFVKHKDLALYPYYALQMAILILTAITPVLILVEGIPKPLQALPAALAAIAAGAIGIAQMRETAGAFEVTATQLKAELLLFQTRAGVYARVADPTGQFIETIARIESETTAEWRNRLIASVPDSTGPP